MVDSSRLGQEAERNTSGVEADTHSRPAGADTDTPAVVVDSRPRAAEQQDTAWATGTCMPAVISVRRGKTSAVPFDGSMSKSE